MRPAVAFCFLSVACCFPLLAQQVSNPAALAKVKTAALVVRATTSVSCGDGSEGTCVRNDGDVATNVKTYVDGTELWQHFDRAEATKADAILEFTVKDGKTTYGRISFSVRDADTNNMLYSEYRDVVMLENDIIRIINHFLKAVEDAKTKLVSKKKP